MKKKRKKEKIHPVRSNPAKRDAESSMRTSNGVKAKTPEEIPAIENSAQPPASDDSVANGSSTSTVEV